MQTKPRATFSSGTGRWTVHNATRNSPATRESSAPELPRAINGYFTTVRQVELNYARRRAA